LTVDGDELEMRRTSCGWSNRIRWVSEELIASVERAALVISEHVELLRFGEQLGD
jgi:hypothetical protein